MYTEDNPALQAIKLVSAVLQFLIVSFFENLGKY